MKVTWNLNDAAKRLECVRALQGALRDASCILNIQYTNFNYDEQTHEITAEPESYKDLAQNVKFTFDTYLPKAEKALKGHEKNDQQHWLLRDTRVVLWEEHGDTKLLQEWFRAELEIPSTLDDFIRKRCAKVFTAEEHKNFQACHRSAINYVFPVHAFCELLDLKHQIFGFTDSTFSLRFGNHPFNRALMRKLFWKVCRIQSLQAVYQVYATKHVPNNCNVCVKVFTDPEEAANAYSLAESQNLTRKMVTIIALVVQDSSAGVLPKNVVVIDKSKLSSRKQYTDLGRRFMEAIQTAEYTRLKRVLVPQVLQSPYFNKFSETAQSATGPNGLLTNLLGRQVYVEDLAISNEEWLRRLLEMPEKQLQRVYTIAVQRQFQRLILRSEEFEEFPPLLETSYESTDTEFKKPESILNIGTQNSDQNWIQAQNDRLAKTEYPFQVVYDPQAREFFQLDPKVMAIHPLFRYLRCVSWLGDSSLAIHTSIQLNPIRCTYAILAQMAAHIRFACGLLNSIRQQPNATTRSIASNIDPVWSKKFPSNAWTEAAAQAAFDTTTPRILQDLNVPIWSASASNEADNLLELCTAVLRK